MLITCLCLTGWAYFGYTMEGECKQHSLRMHWFPASNDVQPYFWPFLLSNYDHFGLGGGIRGGGGTPFSSYDVRPFQYFPGPHSPSLTSSSHRQTHTYISPKSHPLTYYTRIQRPVGHFWGDGDRKQRRGVEGPCAPRNQISSQAARDVAQSISQLEGRGNRGLAARGGSTLVTCRSDPVHVEVICKGDVTRWWRK